ncbi:hypothetical protein CO615_06665 [Lysobacteraceae bacterium NML75-0749]|nr:hypothetical protein CO615_06665 [Xanthomonadaceae bacterium NML75-0749]
MSQVIIRIGPYEWLLPDDEGAAAAIKTLSRGQTCYSYGLWKGELQIDKCDTPETGLTYLPAGTRIVERAAAQPEAKK